MKGAGGGVCQHWEESQLWLLRYPVLDPKGVAPRHTRTLPSQRKGLGGWGK